MTSDDPAPGELVDLAVRLGLQAAVLVRDRPADLQTAAKATPTDAVTVMDRASERLIVAGITRERPDDGIVAEESGVSDADQPRRVRWYVDPLDGTVNYLYDLPQYAVSIAAEVDGQVVAGGVIDVAKHDVYTATLGGGAFCNDAPLRCRAETDLSLALIATGFSYDARRRAAQGEVVRAVLPKVRDIRRMGAAALDLCAVAAGTVDGYFEERLKPWDFAAGALIAAEAGASVGTLGNRPRGESVALAANPALYAALEALLDAATSTARE